MVDRLFVPLNSEHYWNFESGDKDIELRGYNDRFNLETVYPGRPVELRRGYSTEDSLWGEIADAFTFDSIRRVAVRLDHTRILPDSTQEEFVASASELLDGYDRYIAFGVDFDG